MLQQTHPGVPGIGAGVTEFVQRVGDQNHDEVGRRDTSHTTKYVATQRRWLCYACSRSDPRAEQQEPRQDEEDRDANIKTRIERPEVAIRQLPGAIRCVRPHDQQCCNCA
jgi:hypothetical protein